MVAKKTTKPAKKSSAARKPVAKKAPTKKKAAAKKVPAKKKAPARNAAAKKASKAESAVESTPAEKPKKEAAAGVRSNQVVLAHLFALRPRVATSFKPDDFRQAKQRLEDESYASIQEAARAVAEKALELTGSGLPKRLKRR